MFDFIKKSKNVQVVKPNEYLDEVYFFLDNVNLMVQKTDSASIAVRMRHEEESNPEFQTNLFANLDALQSRLVYALSVSHNIAFSDIIDPMTITDSYIGMAITSAYYSGQYDEYNLFLNACIPILPDVTITPEQKPLRYVLETGQGKAMYAFVNQMGEKHENFLQTYNEFLIDMQEAHKRDKVILYIGDEKVESVNGAFVNSLCGKLITDCNLEVEETVSLACIYLLGRLRVDYNLLEMFNDVLT